MPLILPALRCFLRAVPDAAHERVFSRLASLLLAGPSTEARLAPVEGTRLCLVITDTGNRWQFRVADGRLVTDSSGVAWDVRIQGRLADFILLAMRLEDPDTLFFARRLSLEGRTEVALYVKNFIDSLEFDWESSIASVLGPRPATTIVKGLERTHLDRGLDAAARRLGPLVQRIVASDSEAGGAT